MTPPLYLIPAARSGAVKLRRAKSSSFRLEYGEGAWMFSGPRTRGHIPVTMPVRVTRSVMAPVRRAARAVIAVFF